MDNLSTLLWALFVGIGAATLYTFFIKRVFGSLVRTLIEKEAFSQETAIPPGDLAKELNAVLKFALKKGTSITDIVTVSADGKFYIGQDKVSKAKLKYRDEGFSIFLMFITLFFITGIALICQYLFPQSIDFFTDFLKDIGFIKDN